MTRNEIINTYDIDSNGVIISPGEYEGQMLYAPYFHNLILHGLSHAKSYSEDEFSTVFYHFRIYLSDIDLFPELKRVKRLVCHINENGYFICQDFD